VLPVTALLVAPTVGCLLWVVTRPLPDIVGCRCSVLQSRPHNVWSLRPASDLDGEVDDMLVRLCCGQRHRGPVCPDGLVMCCVCFARVPVDGLAVLDSGPGPRVYEDVCVACKRREDVAR
jgi:hypothetical protein